MTAVISLLWGMKMVLGQESPVMLEVKSGDKALGDSSYLIDYHLGEVKPGWSVRNGCVN